MTDDRAPLIIRAFHEAQKRRPYLADDAIIKAIIPPGGDWECVATSGSVVRSIMWGSKEVALVNARGDLDDVTEGHIAMALRAAPAFDAAMRAILVLAESADNLWLIRQMAESVIAFVEMPAPRVVDDEDEEPVEEEDAEITAKIKRLDASTPGWREMTHENGAPKFGGGGMMLDEFGNRSIFDDVDE